MTKTACDPSAQASARRTPRSLLACGTLALTLALSACGGSGKSPQKKAANSGAGSTANSTPAGGVTGSSPATSGSSAGDGATGTSGDFCNVVTRDEAQAILGRAVQQGRSRSGTTAGGVSGSCVYNDANPVTGKPTVVNVIILGTKIPRSIYEQELKHDPQGGDTKPLSGLGEDAFYTAGIVTVFDHGLVLSLEIIKDGRPVDTAAITQLMRTALGRAGHLG